MCKHEWISDVFDDLIIYCEANKLVETKTLVDLAKRIFESENLAMNPSEMTLNDHLVRANNPPQ